MSRPLRYTLLSDGSSDALLKFPVNWALRQADVSSFVDQWADLRLLRSVPRRLRDRVEVAVERVPCDILVVHRDSESKAIAARVREIEEEIRRTRADVMAVCLVPVRMTEAWLLHDESAIRMAAGNPAGTIPIALPPVSTLESEPNPKSLLRQALLDASQAKGRRRDRKARDFPSMRFRVAELIGDWTPLRGLPAFQLFEASLGDAVRNL
jgi:hypothetical protein